MTEIPPRLGSPFDGSVTKSTSHHAGDDELTIARSFLCSFAGSENPQPQAASI